MISYGRTRSDTEPMTVQITETKVFVASNAEQYSEVIEGETVTGWEFDYTEYEKDEYIQALKTENETLEADITNTQLALCEVYKLIAGGVL